MRKRLKKEDIFDSSVFDEFNKNHIELCKKLNMLRRSIPMPIPLQKKQKCVNCGASKVINYDCEYCGT